MSSLGKRDWTKIMGVGSQSKNQKQKLSSQAMKGVVRPAYKPSTAARSAFAKKVREVLVRSAEKKQVDSVTSLTEFGSASSNSQLVIPLLPNASTLLIAQGTAVNQRAGNRVRIKKVTFRGQLSVADYDVTNNPLPQPQNIKMYFLSSKTTPNANIAPLTPPFYRSGATTSAMSGSHTDPYLQLDHESLTVYHEKLFKVGYATFQAAPGGSATYGYYADNDFPLVQHFDYDVTKWCPKEIVWDDTGVTPTSRQLCCVVESTNAIAGGVTANSPSSIVYQIHIEYSDV